MAETGFPRDPTKQTQRQTVHRRGGAQNLKEVVVERGAPGLWTLEGLLSPVLVRPDRQLLV